jgi:hypothetical protein
LAGVTVVAICVEVRVVLERQQLLLSFGVSQASIELRRAVAVAGYDGAVG